MNERIDLSGIKNGYSSAISKSPTSNQTISETIGTFISDAVEFFDDVGDDFTEFVADKIEDTKDMFSEAKAYVSNAAESAFSTIGEAVDNFTSWWDTTALPAVEKAGEVILDVLESAAATLSTFVVSLVEGIGQFGEVLVDLVIMASALIGTVGTGLYDAGQAIYGAITGNEWDSATATLWDNTMAVVGENHVKSWFDNMYENTEVGEWLKENTWGFDVVRGAGSGLGYVAGIVVLTIATFGVGTAATGAATATSVTATQLATTAGVMGFSKGTAEAWGDGAELLEGFGYGTATGLWEGLQFFLGAKIGNLNVLGGAGSASLQAFGQTGCKVLNSLTRILLDGADGGVEGFMQPLLQSIYKDGYYDENGNYIEFTESDNFFERYAEMFDDAGGFQNVLTQGIIGMGGSALGEAFDLTKFLKETKNRISEVEITKAISSFWDVMRSGEQSDMRILGLMRESLKAQLENNNRDALNIINSVIALKSQFPEIKIQTTTGTSCWDPNVKTIFLSEKYLGWGEGTIWHEMGHALLDMIVLDNGINKTWWDNIRKNAQDYASNQGNAAFKKIQNIAKSLDNEFYAKANRIFAEELEASGTTWTKYRQTLIESYSKYSDEQFIDKIMKNKKCPENIRKMVIDVLYKNDDPTLLCESLADLDIAEQIGKIEDKLYRTEGKGFTSLCDIVASIFEGQTKDGNGDSIYTSYGHSAHYYNQSLSRLTLHEVIADFVSLKMLNKTETIQLMKEAFGDELFDSINQIIDNIIQFSNQQ